jgi:hypothetical protein
VLLYIKRITNSVPAMVSRLAFLDDRTYIASKVLPNAYDGVRCLSSKGKYDDSSSIA